MTATLLFNFHAIVAAANDVNFGFVHRRLQNCSRLQQVLQHNTHTAIQYPLFQPIRLTREHHKLA